jgi:Leucine-rich repeat (LRR) protein
MTVVERIQKARIRRETCLNLSRSDWLSEEAAALMGDLKHLEELNLANSHLATVPDAVSTLPGLKYLYLYNNELEALPDTLGALPALIMLHLAHNALRELPEAIGDLASLDRIDVDANRLETLPESIGRLRNLRHLNLAGNRLTQLPGALGHLQSLQWLNLARNQVGDLPTSIGDCTKLETLYLNDNRLQVLPDSIGKLRWLSRLLLSTNRLSRLPNSIGNLQALTELDLADNQLAALPASVSSLSVSRLNLANNQLRALPASMSQMTTLDRLDLRNNPLEALPEGLEVNRLDISSCGRLRTLPSRLIVHEWLELGGTSLTPPAPTVQLGGLTWHGIAIDSHIAFEPETITYQEVIEERNAERRRVLLERMGYDTFIQNAQAKVVDQDRDRGGKRQLLRIEMTGDEPLVCLSVKCPSTGRKYVLRVPPAVRSCRQAAAWIAGFDNPDEYHPFVET